MILFFGDVHGRLAHVERAVAQLNPDAIILLGDIEAKSPLEEVLATVLGKTEIWFIHGNHDTDRLELIDNLTGHGNLHGKVVEINGVRIAGLGGVFRQEVWWPETAEPGYDSYADYRHHLEREHIVHAQRLAKSPAGDLQLQVDEQSMAGRLLKHRSSIFSQEYYALAMQEADILVTHEAPSCHPYGFKAIDELARSMRVGSVFHGHHHDNLDYRHTQDELGFKAYGVGLRGITDLNGVVVKPGELDLQRAQRQGADKQA
ncbi:MAG: metallophosphoesterase [Gallionella sp.]|nr:metallophosphoesterase [Gallionella sp.]